jgi:hypothetical protein
MNQAGPNSIHVCSSSTTSEFGSNTRTLERTKRLHGLERGSIENLRNVVASRAPRPHTKVFAMSSQSRHSPRSNTSDPLCAFWGALKPSGARPCAPHSTPSGIVWRNVTVLGVEGARIIPGQTSQVQVVFRPIFREIFYPCIGR